MHLLRHQQGSSSGPHEEMGTQHTGVSVAVFWLQMFFSDNPRKSLLKTPFNLIYLLIPVDWPLLRCSGQISWLQIRRFGFDSRRYQIFWGVVGLERGPLSLVSTTEELLGRKSSGSGLEIREYGSRNPSRWPRGTLYPQKLALTSPTTGGRSV
jgi:hypothetical protein